MANLKGKITGIVQGDNFEIERTIDNIQIGQILTDGWFTVKESYWSTVPIIQKHITAVASDTQGFISDDGDTDLIAHVVFNLLPADTLLLSEYYRYVYDIQVKTSTGYIYTPESGVIQSFPAVTRVEEEIV